MYDKFGNVTSKGIKVIDYSSTVYTTSYTYDQLGRITGVTYPSSSYGNVSVAYTFDQLRRTTQESNFSEYTYDLRGQINQETLNPTTEVYVFLGRTGTNELPQFHRPMLSVFFGNLINMCAPHLKVF